MWGDWYTYEHQTCICYADANVWVWPSFYEDCWYDWKLGTKGGSVKVYPPVPGVCYEESVIHTFEKTPENVDKCDTACKGIVGPPPPAGKDATIRIETFQDVNGDGTLSCGDWRKSSGGMVIYEPGRDFKSYTGSAVDVIAKEGSDYRIATNSIAGWEATKWGVIQGCDNVTTTYSKCWQGGVQEACTVVPSGVSFACDSSFPLRPTELTQSRVSLGMRPIPYGRLITKVFYDEDADGVWDASEKSVKPTSLTCSAAYGLNGALVKWQNTSTGEMGSSEPNICGQANNGQVEGVTSDATRESQDSGDVLLFKTYTPNREPRSTDLGGAGQYVASDPNHQRMSDRHYRFEDYCTDYWVHWDTCPNDSNCLDPELVFDLGQTTKVGSTRFFLRGTDQTDYTHYHIPKKIEVYGSTDGSAYDLIGQKSLTGESYYDGTTGTWVEVAVDPVVEARYLKFKLIGAGKAAIQLAEIEVFRPKYYLEAADGAYAAQNLRPGATKVTFYAPKACYHPCSIDADCDAGTGGYIKCGYEQSVGTKICRNWLCPTETDCKCSWQANSNLGNQVAWQITSVTPDPKTAVLGWSTTTPDTGPFISVDVDIAARTDSVLTFGVSDQPPMPKYDLTGYVWDDTTTQNCVFDGGGGEGKFGGLTISVTGTSPLKTGTTGGTYPAGTNYTITQITSSTYQVCTTKPATYNWDLACAKDEHGANLPITGNCATININENGKNLNFGLRQVFNPWFQVSDSDVHSNGDLTVNISPLATNPCFVATGRGIGGLVTATGAINLNGQPVSCIVAKRWQIPSYNQIPWAKSVKLNWEVLSLAEQNINWAGLVPNTVYFKSGEMDISPPGSYTVKEGGVEGGVAVIVIDGNLNFNAANFNAKDPQTMGIIFLVRNGKTAIAKEVKNIDSLVLDEKGSSVDGGTITVEGGTTQKDNVLTVNGGLLAEIELSLQRDRAKETDKNKEPVEIFNFNPLYFLLLTSDIPGLSNRYVSWQEVQISQ